MKHIVSVSGGKDSTATYLRALERGLPFRAVAADTGNEHPWTYEAIDNLSRLTGGPKVEMVKADFSRQILRKRAFIEAKWPADLQAGKPGFWDWRPDPAGVRERQEAFRAWRLDKSLPKPKPVKPDVPPPLPEDVFSGRHRPINVEGGRWVWIQGYAPKTAEEAAEVVEVALTWLTPTGNPYLDLCIWKGRFPSRRAQFCTEELKITPINAGVTGPLLQSGETVISWQGVRAAESIERAHLPKLGEINHEYGPGRLLAFRPLLTWSIEDVFAIAERHGIPRNPLYAVGCSRVGCFPCINATKAEIALVDRVFPEQIVRLEEWETRVSRCSKRGMTTFFNIVNDPVMAQMWEWSVVLGERLDLSHENHGIREMIQWAKTDRGGRQFSLAFTPAALPSDTCTMHGACE